MEIPKSPVDLPGYNTLKRCREGWMLFNKNDKYLGKSLDIYGEFSQGEADLMRQVLTPGAFAIDIGAYNGDLTIPMANFVGPTGLVIAFEPQRLLFQTLCANVAINSLINVVCRYEAVADEPGTLNVPVFHPDQDMCYGNYSLEGWPGGEQVSVITLDSLNITRCDVIKIDVEGMERKVLLGGKNLIMKHRPILYVENDRADQKDALIQTLDEFGYEMYWHFPRLYNPDNYFANPENIFDNIASENMLCIPRERGTKVDGLQRVEVPAGQPNASPVQGQS